MDESRQVLRDVLGDEGKIDMEAPNVPLLLIGAEEDKIIPSNRVRRNAHAYSDPRTHSEFAEFTRRGHFICGEPAVRKSRQKYPTGSTHICRRSAPENQQPTTKKMRALCWHGTKDVRVDTVEDPSILDPKDIIIQITASGICGSDLHLYNGLMPTMEEGDIIGHEPMGIVVEVGSEVKKFQLGDRVVVPFVIACGACFFCEKHLFRRATPPIPKPIWRRWPWVTLLRVFLDTPG